MRSTGLARDEYDLLSKTPLADVGPQNARQSSVTWPQGCVKTVIPRTARDILYSTLSPLRITIDWLEHHASAGLESWIAVYRHLPVFALS